MPHKDDSGRNGAIHHGESDAGDKTGLKDTQKLKMGDPGKQHPGPGDQGPHGGGEGETGMQPGAGHPSGR